MDAQANIEEANPLEQFYLEVTALVEKARQQGLLAFSGEIMLLEWTKSSSKDMPRIKFGLTSDEEMEPFERAHVRKGKQVGQRYLSIMFELGDKEHFIGQGATERKSRDPNDHDEALTTPEDILSGKHLYGRQARSLFRMGFFFNAAVRRFAGCHGMEDQEDTARKFAAMFDFLSIGDVPPSVLALWAKKEGVLLPAEFANNWGANR